MPQYEWDSQKNQSNFRKHGLHLSAFREIMWDHTITFEFQVVDGEERELVIGPVGDRLVVAVVTQRSGTFRVISLRHALQKEIDRWRVEMSK